MFARLGRFCFRRRWLVVIAWVAALVVGGAVLGAVGTSSRSGFELPDVESKRGTDILDAHFGGVGAGFGGSVVFAADQGVADPEVEAAMSRAFERIDDIPGLTVTSPYAPEGARQVSAAGPEAGRIAYATIDLPPDVTQEEAAVFADQIRADLPPRPRGRADRAGRRDLRRLRGAVVRGDRPRLRHRHPDPRVRLGAGDGPADRRGPGRHRRRRRSSPGCSANVIAMPDFAIDPRGDDRPRRRHRLRAVHRHPLPREPARGPRPSSESTVDRHRHRRPRGAVRRHHRRHLAARHAPDGPQRSSAASAIGAAVGRGHHHDRLAHAAAGAARLRRAAGSRSPAGAGSSPPASSRSPWSASASGSTPLAGAPAGWPWSCCWPASPSRRCASEVPRRGAQAAPTRPSPTGGAASSSTARGRPSSAGVAVLAACSPLPVLGLRLGFSDEGNYPSRHAPPARPTTCWPRASGPGSTARCIAGRRAARRAPTPPTLQRGRPPRWRRPTASRSPSPGRSPTTRTTPTAVLWRVIPTTAPQDAATDRPRQPPARRRAPGGHRGHRPRRVGRRLGRHRRRLHRATWPTGCRCSSAPC